MRIRIAAVGKLNKKYLKDAQAEYVKRLSRFASVDIAEIPEARLPDNPSARQVAQALEKESRRIQKAAAGFDSILVLAVEGKPYTSETFARQIEKTAESGRPDMCFIIGSSYGLSPEVKHIATSTVSFSSMTFPHQLFRIILLEQAYRAFKIIRRETYHK